MGGPHKKKKKWPGHETRNRVSHDQIMIAERPVLEGI